MGKMLLVNVCQPRSKISRRRIPTTALRPKILSIGVELVLISWRAAWPFNSRLLKYAFALHVLDFTLQTEENVERKIEVEEQKDSIPQTRHRQSRKRRLCAGSTDCSEDGAAAEIRQQMTEASSEIAPQNNLSPDHPVNQPIETLLFSIYQVFLQAGKTGLTAREAVSRILERGLPGLHEGGVVPRVEVAKILRTSPYFMQLEESKFVLCSAIIGNEGQHLCSPVSLLEGREKVTVDEVHEETEKGKKVKQSGSWQYWAALAAIRKVRTRRRSLTLSQSMVSPCLSRESVGGEGDIHRS